jgi:membrane fusion protein, multidrug efflux system
MKLHVIGLLAALGALAGCGKKAEPHGSSAAAELPPVAVQTVTVTAQELSATIEITGTVRAVERAMLAAKLMGAIEEMPVTLGQHVRAGDVLVSIAAGEVSARVAQARTQLEAARRDLERERALQAKGASTAETVRNLEDRVTTAEAQLREAEVMLGYAVLRAPFDGVIAQKLANQGDLATPGTPLLEVHGLGKFEIEAAVPETLAATLKVGEPVRIAIPASSAAFTGKVAEISSAADARARAVSVKIAVPAGENVRSGQFARLQLPGPKRPALLVPVSAVSIIGQMERVFAVSDNGRAALRLVKTGPHRDEQVEILSGVRDGDRLVLSPPAGLIDGQPLEIRP